MDMLFEIEDQKVQDFDVSGCRPFEGFKDSRVDNTTPKIGFPKAAALRVDLQAQQSTKVYNCQTAVDTVSKS